MLAPNEQRDASADLLRFVGNRRFATILADPPWQFLNKTGKIAPEHKRLSRYGTMRLPEIMALPVSNIAAETAHLYLWCPNALLPDGLAVMDAWGFRYKSNLIWHKIRKDGGSDGRGVGFYFRNVTELILFGVRGRNARTLSPGRRQVNLIATRKREHSRKPDEQYAIIEACSPGPFIELFSRGTRHKWTTWGNEANGEYRPTWNTYARNSQAQKVALLNFVMETEIHKLLVSQGYRLVEDAWNSNGRITYQHDEDADRSHMKKLRQCLLYSGWQIDRGRLRAFQHTRTKEFIEIEIGGPEVTGHFLHFMKPDVLLGQ
jgi:N6-adenosine-specific RNA methylase IME4